MVPCPEAPADLDLRHPDFPLSGIVGETDIRIGREAPDGCFVPDEAFMNAGPMMILAYPLLSARILLPRMLLATRLFERLPEWIVRVSDPHEGQPRSGRDGAAMGTITSLEGFGNPCRRPGSLSDLDEGADETSDLSVQKAAGAEYQGDMQASPVHVCVNLDPVESPDR